MLFLRHAVWRNICRLFLRHTACKIINHAMICAPVGMVGVLYCYVLRIYIHPASLLKILWVCKQYGGLIIHGTIPHQNGSES